MIVAEPPDHAKRVAQLMARRGPPEKGGKRDMSDQQPPQPGDWRAQRRQERQERRASRRAGWGGAPIGAIVLVVIGVVLLLENFGYSLPERWWALLLLLPAIGSLVAAIRSYRSKGSTPDVLAALAGAVIFTVLSLALFLGVDWGIFWPVILILLGAGALLRAYWPKA